jgi:hypothetical protein
MVIHINLVLGAHVVTVGLYEAPESDTSSPWRHTTCPIFLALGTTLSQHGHSIYLDAMNNKSGFKMLINGVW